ncbi:MULTISPECIES: anthranilate synthase family protein [Streptomyces]|uniref:anthranilate synthase n=1 Tax=Streptomyces koelreuteriae TaxID=2838015 RepID=A0ABX8FLY8_9ACTN|nr:MULTISPECIES: anthranilate synthase family protein [Streptomyces]QWB22139.1 chorismate-binding protein [Streptomyces koelreuteriae]UUA05079.1 anthranilate synthase family protein [Streptomyces koelreuteriae]UUA12703.1 anthranilate synthase family protein [Streptomyces sp. CRCS-T-1]
MNSTRLLEQVLSPDRGAFALLHRPDTLGPDRVEILLGRVSTPARLADIPAADRSGRPGEARHETLVLVPHQQITERGFAAAEDGSPLLAMEVTDQGQISTTEALRALPDEPITLSGGRFDTDDEAYADTVREVLDNEIGTGEGSNFVIKRSFVTTITGYSTRSALSLFRRLLTRESGAYWTFVVHTGTRTFVGATPERHVSLRDGVAAMTPISGTYRYPSTGPVLSEVMEFLTDGKETDELYMVLDEELKMMARVCRGGGRVTGPFLREMAWLAHTEYVIEGRSDLDPRDILRETMFAPTVTGSPLENACRVIARYEPRGRGYYGGVVALIGRDADGARTLDSAILIRTADIRASDAGDSAQVEVGVGATLVRHSEPAAEVAETRTKAAGVLSALGADERLDEHPLIRKALGRRNETIANFWLSETAKRARPHPVLDGRRALVVDAEDTFSAMLAHQLRAIGLTVELGDFDAPHRFDDHDLVVLGPGPGDPRESDHPRMAHLTAAIEELLGRRTPFLAVCLSHQLLCRHLGLELRRRDVPNQGTQREIDLFGSRERVGFYNSYSARARTDRLQRPGVGEVKVGLDPVTGEVHALRGPHFGSVQFHLESVLTQDSERVLAELLVPLMETAEVLNV